MFGEMAFLYPVLTMFTWLTNTGAAGLVLLMAIIAVAVICFFRRDNRGLSIWTTVIAPAASGLALLWVFVMILANFQLMLDQEQPDATTFILPGMILVAGVVGVIWALVLRSSKPEIYRQIGHGTEPGAYGTEVVDVVEQ
jgi:amino acid transporter